MTQIITTACFIPFMEIMLIPLRCDALLERMGRGTVDSGSAIGLGPQCSSPTDIVLFSMSITSLCLFVPFSVVFVAVLFEPSPASPDWFAKVSGREQIIDVISRAVLAGIAVWGPSLPHLFVSCAFAVVLLGQALITSNSLPFYRTWVNSFRTTLYLIVAWISLGSIVLVGLRDQLASDEHDMLLAARIIAGLLVIPIVVGWTVPFARVKKANKMADVIIYGPKSQPSAISDSSAASAAHAGLQVATIAPSSQSSGAGTIASPLPARLSQVSPANSEMRHNGAIVRPSTMTVDLSARDNGADDDADSTAPARSVLPKPSASRRQISNPLGSTATAPVLAARTSHESGLSHSHAQQQHHHLQLLQAEAGAGQVALNEAAAASSSPNGSGDAQASGRDGYIYVGREGNLEGVETSVLFKNEPGNVELIARCVLRRKLDPLVPEAVHQSRIEQQIYAKEAIAKAEQIYTLGLAAFPDSPEVRVSFALFIANFRHDDARALGMLQSVLKCKRVSMDHAFALFSFGRTLEQQRQSSDLGEVSMNMVGVLAFRQMYTQALTHHQNAIKRMLALWQTVVEPSSTAKPGTESPKGFAALMQPVNDSRKQQARETAVITEHVARILSSRQQAEALYHQLLKRYPNAPLLLRTYSFFQRDVCNEPNIAALYLAKAETIEADAVTVEDQPVRPGGQLQVNAAYGTTAAEALHAMGTPSRGILGAASVAGGKSKAGSRKAPSMGSNSSGGRGGGKLDIQVRDDGMQAVNGLRARMKWGLRVLLLVAILTFATVRVVLGQISSQIDLVHKASLLPKLQTDGNFWSRVLELTAADIAASNNTGSNSVQSLSSTGMYEISRQRLAESMSALKMKLDSLYNPSNLWPKMQHSWDDPTMQRKIWIPGPPSQQAIESASLFEVFNGFIYNAMTCAQRPYTAMVPALANVYPPLRYLMDNAAAAWQAAYNIVGQYADHAIDVAANYQDALIVLIALSCGILGVLYWGVFEPALLKVHETSSGVKCVADAIPRSAARALVARYQRLLNQLDNLQNQINTEADGDGDGSEADDLDDVSVPDGDQGSESDCSYTRDHLRDGEERPHRRSIDRESDAESSWVSGRSGRRRRRRGSGSRQRGRSCEDRSPAPQSPSTNGRHVAFHDSNDSVAGGHANATHAVSLEAHRLPGAVTASPVSPSDSVPGQVPPHGRNGDGGDALGKPDMSRSGSAQADELLFAMTGTPTRPQGGSQEAAASGADVGASSSSSGSVQPVPLLSSPLHANRRGSQDPGPASVMSPEPPLQHRDGSAHHHEHHGGRRDHGQGDGHDGEHLSRQISDRSHGPSHSPNASQVRRASLSVSGAVALLAEDNAQIAIPTAQIGRDMATAAMVSIAIHKMRRGRGGEGHGSGSRNSDGDKDTVTSSLPADPGAEASSLAKSPARAGASALSPTSSKKLLPPMPGAPHTGGVGGSEASHITRLPSELDNCEVQLATVVKPYMDKGPASRVIFRGIAAVLRHKKQRRQLREVSPLLKMLSFRFYLCLLVVWALQAINFALNYEEVRTAAEKARAIQVAGARRAYSSLISALSMELVINDGTIGPIPALMGMIQESIVMVEKTHRALLVGDASLGVGKTIGSYAPQDELVLGTSSGAFDLAAIDAAVGTGPQSGNGSSSSSGAPSAPSELTIAASFGLSNLLDAYTSHTKSLLARFDPWFAAVPYNTTPWSDAAAGIKGYTVAYLSSDEDISFIISVDRGFGILGAALEQSMQFYFDEMQAENDQILQTQIGLFVLTVAVLGVLQFVVLIRLFDDLSQEAKRTEDMLRLIPIAVVEATPRLRGFFSMGGSSSGTGASPSPSSSTPVSSSTVGDGYTRASRG